MEKSLEPVVQQFALSEGLFRRALKKLTRDEVVKRPGERSNPMLWIAGHIANSRYLILNMLRVDCERPWSDLFSRGSALRDDFSLYPDLAEILDIWEKATEMLRKRFETLTASELESDSPIKVPSEDGRILSSLSFFAFHETYHIGQMAYLLTWLDKEQLVG